MSEGVLLSHPHAAVFATANARALREAGMLRAYVTGLTAADDSISGRLLRIASRYQRSLSNRLISGVGNRHLHSQVIVEASARAAARLAQTVSSRQKAYDYVFPLHDAATAMRPWPAEIGAVYAYEDAALATFSAARRRGLVRLWDLPIPHWRTLERMWINEATRWPHAMGNGPPIEPEWKKNRKDRELDLADAVFVASRHTRESLDVTDCKKPIFIVPYGFPVEQFAQKAKPNDGPFTVLSVGTHDLRKGTPYLLEAWKQARLKDARLRLVGPMHLNKEFLDGYAGLFEHVSHIPRADLEAEYQRADVLAFPTLGDGFGMVMQEAMCCGTPVITTRSSGGPECMPGNRGGWLTRERNIDDLVDRLREAAGERDKTHGVGREAAAIAKTWTWGDAGAAFVSKIRAALGYSPAIASEHTSGPRNGSCDGPTPSL